MYQIPSSLKSWPGKIELPEVDEFDRTMFVDFGEFSDKFKKEYPKLPNFPHGVAYSAALFIAKHGTWEMETLNIDDFLSWRDDPKAEKTRFVHWLAVRWKIYWQILTLPNV